MLFDVDIDLPSTVNKEQFGVRAMIYKDETLHPHPCGYYRYEIPQDPHTGLCPVPYERMEELGFQKIDLLTNSVYDQFVSKEELLEKMNREPDWSKFQEEKYVYKLPQLKDHLDVLRAVKPQSMDDLADVIALIRPAKRSMINQYLKNPSLVRPNLYREPKGKKVFFKKSHAYAYACMIVAYLNKLEETMEVIKIY